MIPTHGLMDIKPVNRSSVVKALGWWLLQVALVVVVVTTATAAAAVVAQRAKNRQEKGMGTTVDGAKRRCSTVVNRPAVDVPRVIDDVCLHDPELGLRTNTAAGGSITTGISSSSWGERIRFSVEPLPTTESEATAACRPAFPLDITSWGRREKNLYAFPRAVHETPAPGRLCSRRRVAARGDRASSSPATATGKDRHHHARVVSVGPSSSVSPASVTVTGRRAASHCTRDGNTTRTR